MYEGYLPTAHGPVEAKNMKSRPHLVLPKLHEARCVIMFEKLNVSAIAAMTRIVPRYDFDLMAAGD
jgi:hypothetical protein